MAVRKRSRIWTQQPQVAVGIDWSNPITRGLIAAGVPGAFSAVGQYLGTGLPPTAKTTPQGVGRVFGSGSKGDVPIPRTLSSYSLLCVALISDESTERHLLDYDYVGHGHRGFQLRTSGSNIEFIAFDASVFPGFATVSTSALSTGPRVVTIIARQKAGLMRMDTTIGAAESLALATTKGLATSLPLVVGNYAYYQTFTSHPILSYGLFDHYISDQQVDDLLDTPWQIFAPQTRRRLISAGAGGDLNISGALASASASGFTANVDRQNSFAASLASASASAFNATVDQQLAISATFGQGSASGFTVGIDRQNSFTVSLAQAIASASAASIEQQSSFTASVAQATAIGFTAAIEFAGSLNISATPATAAASGFSANIDQQVVIPASLAQAVAGGFSASIGNASDGSISDADIVRIAEAVGNRIVEGGMTADTMLRIMFAALTGKTVGIGTMTEQYMAQDGITPRIVAGFDTNSNRTSITLNGT